VFASVLEGAFEGCMSHCITFQAFQ